MGNKIRHSIYRLLKKGFLTASVVFTTSMFVALANATTYYISPTGADTNSGTSSTSPWKTFGFAIPRLRAGDTLILRNGIYSPIRINCGTNAVNGVFGQPITIKAENERQAFINGDGSAVTFVMNNCSYWVIHGLRMRSADNPANTMVGSVMNLGTSSKLIIRRNLLTHNNRYANGAVIDGYATNSLIEENEIYYFHRNGMGLRDGNTWRRNYANSRGYADIAGGYRSQNHSRGENAFIMYPASNNIVENNISEGNEVGVGIHALQLSINNKILGNISIGDTYGYLITARGENPIGVNQMPQNTVMNNNVAINSVALGGYFRGNKNTVINGMTIMGAQYSSSFQADLESSAQGDFKPTITFNNVLVFNGRKAGFYVLAPYTFTSNNVRAYNNAGGNFISTAAGRFENSKQIDPPRFGTCKVWVPAGSLMKGKGLGGADVGANILYRYQGGVLTTTPLWNPSTGEFPHGAIVPGVNDIAGSSAFDVHKRLNVNTNGCSFPSGYGGTSLAPLLKPTKLMFTK